MNEINRPGSTELIDFDFFEKYNPNRAIKMTISKVTLGNLFHGIKFCHEHGFDVQCNLAYGEKWESSDVLIFDRELELLIDYYLQNSAIKPCSLLYAPLIPKRDVFRKWCGVGTHNCSYSTEGVAYPCQLFMSQTGCDYDFIIFKDEFDRDEIDKKCVDCIFEPSCPTCYGFNYLERHNICQRDDGLCSMNKVMLIKRAQFLAILWNMNRLLFSEDEIIETLRAIHSYRKNKLI